MTEWLISPESIAIWQSLYALKMKEWSLTRIREAHDGLYICGFPRGSSDKESNCNAGDLGSIPGLGRSPGEGNGYPLQYSGLENPMDSVVHGVTKSRTPPGDFHFHCPFHPKKAIEKVMETIKSNHLDTEDVLYIRIKYYLLIKNLNVAICNMKLGIIILSEVTQRKTNTTWYQLYMDFFKKDTN